MSDLYKKLRKTSKNPFLILCEAIESKGLDKPKKDKSNSETTKK